MTDMLISLGHVVGYTGKPQHILVGRPYPLNTSDECLPLELQFSILEPHIMHKTAEDVMPWFGLLTMTCDMMIKKRVCYKQT